ncbi:MAG TPA: hypothetical protein VGC24_03940 [Burkholderiaceae bacterium]
MRMHGKHKREPGRSASIRKLAGAATLLLAASTAGAATVTVAADSHFFAGWTFNTMDSPATPCGSEDTPASTVWNGALGSTPFTLTAAASPAPEQWQNCPTWIFGGGLPVNIDKPASISAINIRRGVTTYTFGTPLPVGSTYFLQDVDSRETVNVSFADCGGNPVDASGFDLLRVSNASATLPLVTPGPTWVLTTAVADVNAPNELVGIVIKASNVCAVKNISTAGSNSGGELFFFGKPPAAASVPAAVPLLNTGTLALLAVLLGGGTLLAPRKRRG